MNESFIEIPLSPADPQRYETLSRILHAASEGERLASWRRALTILLSVTGSALVLIHVVERPRGAPAARALFALLTILLVKMARLLWLERRNRLATHKLLEIAQARQH